MSTKVSGSPIAVKTLCERQAPMSRRGRHALRPATQLLGLRLAATVVERSQNRIRGSDRANAYFGRDEFVLHSPVSRDESGCVGQNSTTIRGESGSVRMFGRVLSATPGPSISMMISM